MSDDDERRRPDETGEFFPFADEEETRPNGGPRSDDRTARMPRVPADPDRTTVVPAVDDDATQVTPQAPRGDATAVFPPTADDGTRTERHPRGTDNWADEAEPVWSARAGVRTPRYTDDPAQTDWATVPADEPRGRWWTPIAVGIVGLLLLGLLGWGIYLIVQASDDGDATPAVTASPAAPATDVPTDPATTAPTTAPTTTQPTSSPTPSPTDVAVPALKGLSTEEARAALDRMSLNYRLRFVPDDAPAGTVIDSDPPEGQQVPADTVITLIIASAPTTPATVAPTETPTGPDGPDQN